MVCDEDVRDVVREELESVFVGCDVRFCFCAALVQFVVCAWIVDESDCTDGVCVEVVDELGDGFGVVVWEADVTFRDSVWEPVTYVDG